MLTAHAPLQDFLKKNGPLGAVFGHAGMVSSAEAILKDMEEHGVLQTLLQGEEYKGQECALQSSFALPPSFRPSFFPAWLHAVLPSFLASVCPLFLACFFPVLSSAIPLSGSLVCYLLYRHH